MKTSLTIKLLDTAKSTNINGWLKKYEKFKSLRRDQVANYQLSRLKKLLLYVNTYNPYYSNLFNQVKVDVETINSINDLKQLPTLNRDIIRDNFKDLLSINYSKNRLSMGSSSGTTGIPLNYFFDKHALSAGVAAGYALWGMSGWELGQRNIHIWGNQASIERWKSPSSKAKNFLISQKNIAATLLNNPNNFSSIATSVIKFRPISIEGYSSSIYELAKYFKENNLNVPSLKMVLTTAENLEEYQKDLIEEVFAPTGDLYGSGEVLGIATRPINDDKYYILDPHVIVETIDSGNPGMKEILLTDLDNYAMPLIRYRIGDMIDELHEPEPNAKYPFTWFTKLHGRSSDIITLPNGKKFHPVNIFGGTLFRKFKGITRHKTIWDGQKLEFVFEAKGFIEKDSLHDALKQLLEPYQCHFIMTFTEKIEPSLSGKYKYMEIVKTKTN